jgi:hypothetical protein
MSRALSYIGRRSAVEAFMQADWPTTADRGYALAMIESELQEYFDKCDHDDDGRIQYEEFLRLLDYLHARSSNPDPEQLFRRMDNDHDGFIDIQQFVAGWME